MRKLPEKIFANISAIPKGYGEVLLKAFQAIWQDDQNFFPSRKIAVTIQCERCCRPYTYWVKEYRPGGQLRHYCDSCISTEK